MHELGIAESILARVQRELTQCKASRATKVGVRIGELSGVDPAALSFGFEALVKDTPFESLVLEIDFRKRKQHCAACACEFETTSLLFSSCPNCGSGNTVCVAGQELDIAFIELEELACV